MNRDSWIFYDESFGGEEDHGQPAAEAEDSFVYPAQPQQDADPFRTFTQQQADAILNSLSTQERAALPKSLNRMQQQILPHALGSDESLVLGAPTGAGKTAILDMAILRSVLLDDSSTQIYYVAPSKALCRLQSLGFAHRFRYLNLGVDVVTGDDEGGEEGGGGDDAQDGGEDGQVHRGSTARTQPQQPHRRPQQQARQHTLIVCTPEKLEAETRRCTDERLAGPSSHRVVLLVDEVHHLGEAGRGAVLELVLTRFLWAFRKKRQLLRFVCVSATIPNINQVALWLNNAAHFEFTERPVPLTVRVLGYPKSETRSDYLFEQDLDRHVPDVLRQFGVGKPALVFVSSRKGAKDLAGKLRQAGFGSKTPSMRAMKTEDDALGECLRWGIGFHSAGLSSADRALVENLFREGNLLVVCCTSTLAVGVDLPANLCVIRSTRAYRGPLLGFQDLERATLIQMIGRAGRPGYDTEGTAVIMTSRGEESKFSDLSKGLLAVESRLVGNALLEGLNAEIVRGRICSREDCANWWRMTFAGVEQQHNMGQWRPELLESLFALDCVREKPSGGLEPTATGRVASTHHIRLETIARFAKVCRDEPLGDVVEEDDPVRWDLQALAKAVCDGAEFSELLPRRDQKKFLNTVAWSQGRFKAPKSLRVSDGADAAFQLMQAVMGGIALPDQNLRQNAALVFERAPRLCRALLKMLVDVRSNKALVCSLFSKCLAQRCWEFDQVGQLTGVGLKTKEKLLALGVQKLADVAMGKGGLPTRSVLHAKALLGQKRVPQASFVDSALVISLSPPAAAAAATAAGSAPSKKKAFSSSGWWLTCLGGPGNKLLCWSETLDRLVIPSKGLDRIMVFAIHQEALGVDSRMIARVDHAAQQVHLISMDSDFWEGFFLSALPPTTTPVKKAKTAAGSGSAGSGPKKKTKSSPAPPPPSSSSAQIRDRLSQYFYQGGVSSPATNAPSPVATASAAAAVMAKPPSPVPFSLKLPPPRPQQEQAPPPPPSARYVFGSNNETTRPQSYSAAAMHARPLAPAPAPMLQRSHHYATTTPPPPQYQELKPKASFEDIFFL